MNDAIEKAREAAREGYRNSVYMQRNSEHLSQMDVALNGVSAALDAFLAALKDQGLVIEQDWRPIESGPVPLEEPIHLFGYNVQGHMAPGGPYNWYFSTIGEMNDYGPADDLMKASCDCSRGGEMQHPTHWKPLPAPPAMTESENG